MRSGASAYPHDLPMERQRMRIEETYMEVHSDPHLLVHRVQV